MEKINGTLYAPIDDPNQNREKMYIETVAGAVVMEDGSTLEEIFDNRDKRVIISNNNPNYSSLWIKPTNGINPDTYFNFSDIKPTIPDNTVPVHTLRTPADSDGVRQVVYPLTDSDQVYINGTDTLDTLVNRYDLGFDISRTVPDHKQLWGDEILETVNLYDSSQGTDVDVVVMNDFFLDQVVINTVTHVSASRIFDLGLGDMVLISRSSPLINAGDGSGVKQCQMQPVDQHIVDISPFLLNSVIIDDVEYEGYSNIINYGGSKWVFFSSSKFIVSSTQPNTRETVMWGDVVMDMTEWFDGVNRISGSDVAVLKYDKTVLSRTAPTGISDDTFWVQPK